MEYKSLFDGSKIDEGEYKAELRELERRHKIRYGDNKKYYSDGHWTDWIPLIILIVMALYIISNFGW